MSYFHNFTKYEPVFDVLSLDHGKLEIG